MFSKFISYIFILFCGITFSSCFLLGDKNDEEPKEPWDNGKPTYWLDDTIKLYTVFQPGTWWVYQDSASGDYDTIKVETITKEVAVSSGADFNYEYIRMFFSSSSHDYEVSATSSAWDYISESGIQYSEYTETVFDSNFKGQTLFFRAEGDSIIVKVGATIYEDEWMPRIIYKEYGDYSNVHSFIHPFQKSIYLPRVTYFAPRIGQFRKEMFNGQVWKLIDYHIVQ